MGLVEGSIGDRWAVVRAGVWRKFQRVSYEGLWVGLEVSTSVREGLVGGGMWKGISTVMG